MRRTMCWMDDRSVFGTPDDTIIFPLPPPLTHPLVGAVQRLSSLRSPAALRRPVEGTVRCSSTATASTVAPCRPRSIGPQRVGSGSCPTFGRTNAPRSIREHPGNPALTGRYERRDYGAAGAATNASTRSTSSRHSADQYDGTTSSTSSPAAINFRRTYNQFSARSTRIDTPVSRTSRAET